MSLTKIQSNALAQSAITSLRVADNAITTVKLATNAVTTGILADNAVTTVKLSANAVTTGIIADNAITTVKLATNAVTTGILSDQSVGSGKLLSNLELTGATTYVGSAIERTTVLASNVVANITFNPYTQSVVYYAANSGSNLFVTINFVGLANLTAGNTVSGTVIFTNNATFKANITAVQVEGSGTTVPGGGATVNTGGTITGNTLRWLSSVPSGATNVELYAFSIIKNAANSYIVLGSKSNFS